MSDLPVTVTRVTFDDEFTSFSNSPAGTSGTWMTSYPYGGEAARTLSGNNEAEYYSDSSVGENPFSLNSGVLSITASVAAKGSNPYNLPYDSGIITTAKSFSQTYGYFEVNAQLPAQQGLWPAFWMLPASINYTSELDIFETVDKQPTTLYSTTHGTTNGVWGSDSQKFTVPDITSGFHTYGVDWEPTTTRFYVDGKLLGSAPTPTSMNDPMFLILNLAVGGAGSWPGAPDSTTTLPSSLKIDYVRAYATAGTTYVGGSAAISTPVTTPPVTTPPVTTPPVTTPPVTTAPATVTIGTGSHTLALKIAEDAWNGNALFTVSVDGTQIGGTQTATASHAAGATQTFNVLGNFAAGAHSVTVNFLNNDYGGSATMDRNLYVASSSIDGTAIASGSLTMYSGGPSSFNFAVPATTTTPPPAAADTLDVKIAESAWNGDAQFTISVDGTQVGGTRTATASHAAGAVQDVALTGNWGSGAHTVGISFINDAYGGTASTDRNLFVTGITYDGRSAAGTPKEMDSNGTATFAVPAAAAAKATALTVNLSEDAYMGNAQYTLGIDGVQVAAGAATASHAAGASQAVAVSKVLSTGMHDLSVSFLNDLYGNSATTDRNLYVKSVAVNGTTVAGASATMLSTGTSHFEIYVP